jgi:hypothetical protein
VSDGIYDVLLSAIKLPPDLAKELRFGKAWA